MKLKTRFSILAVLIVTFVVIAPLIIFFALGYRWDSITNRFVPTGTLLVASIPRDATVSLNSEPTSHSTPATIRLVVPGEYEVSFIKSGYVPQTRRITIFEKQVSTIRQNNRPVALFLEQKTPQLLATSTQAITLFQQEHSSPPDSDSIYFVQQGALQRRLGNSQQTEILANNLPNFTEFKVFESQQQQLFVLLDNALYSFSDNTLTLTATGIENGSWSRNAEIFTYYSKNALWLFDSRLGIYELITRTATNISAATYDPEIHHIVYASDGAIHSIEADSNTTRTSNQILQTENQITNLSLTREGKVLYYLTDEPALSSVELR